jgi:FixJ family two-component response regulator
MSIPQLRTRVVQISVVDDDDSVRESLQGLLESLGYTVETFPSAEAFLGSDVLKRTDCLILDVRMPGMSGPELQQELSGREEEIPIVFITSYGYEDVVPRVRRDRVVHYLHKPFSEDALLQAIRSALRPT